MYRVLWQSSLTIALLSGLPKLQAAEPPAAPAPEAKKPLRAPEADPAQKAIADRFRAVRIVRDLAEFDILNLKPRERGAWIVAGILPGGMSGDLYMQGGYLKAETGEFVDNGVRPSLVLLVGGQWERLELLSGEAPPEGRFEWKEPYVDGSFDRNFNIYDGYSVFISPNSFATVICTYNADRKGAEQFSSVTAIPDGWKSFVKPAYEYHALHSADFAKSDLVGLRKLATGENPFIALTAIRQILRRSTSEEETDQLVDLARSLPTFRQAVLTFWLLKRDDDNARDILLRTVSRSKTTAELRGVALGMESWAASHGRATYFFDPGPGRNLRDKVLERWQSFDPAPVGEEPWKSWEKILAAAGLQEGESTDDAKPSVEPRNDSKQEPKSSGMKERFRFEFWKRGAFQQRLVIQDSVALNEPFDIRAKNGATATGVLRRTAAGGLHFKGEVSHAGMSAVFDTPVELGKGGIHADKTKGGPDSDGFQWISVFFSLSHVEENVPAGLGLGVSGKLDQLIVIPGPQGETQRPSVWFDSRLKAENVLTADQETWVLFRSKQLNPTRMWIERLERDENTFTVTMNGPEATAGDNHYEVHGVNLGKLAAGTYEVKWIIRQSTSTRDKGPTGELKENFTVRATGNPEGKSTQTNKSDGAKPPLEPRNDSKKQSKSSGFKERVRFNFSVLGPFHTEPIINDIVTVNEPFNIRRKDGAAATGVLRRTAEGGLHFKGEVSRGRTAVFDAPVVLRLVELPKAGPGVFLGHLSSAQPRGAGHEVFDIGFSLSHVEEHVPAGLGLGVSGKQDQVIVVPGPKAEKEKQGPSAWFDSRLKADNVLTADQETWVLFRSKQLNRTLLWIERIERDDNTFTVTMNGPEATAGDDHYEVHGVNLGKLPAGTYEVKWIIRSGKGGSPPQDSKPPEPVELKSSFKILET